MKIKISKHNYIINKEGSNSLSNRGNKITVETQSPTQESPVGIRKQDTLALGIDYPEQ
jgi:hypothetical protein